MRMSYEVEFTKKYGTNEVGNVISVDKEKADRLIALGYVKPLNGNKNINIRERKNEVFK